MWVFWSSFHVWVFGCNKWKCRYDKYRDKAQFEEEKNWVMFSGKMCFIFTNCNVSFFDNISFRQNFFLCQFCTRQRYVLVHVLKQFVSKGSMNMVKISDYRMKMIFFYQNINLKKIAWQMFVQCTIILSVISGII